MIKFNKKVTVILTLILTITILFSALYFSVINTTLLENYFKDKLKSKSENYLLEKWKSSQYDYEILKKNNEKFDFTVQYNYQNPTVYFYYTSTALNKEMPFIYIFELNYTKKNDLSILSEDYSLKNETRQRQIVQGFITFDEFRGKIKTQKLDDIFKKNLDKLSVGIPEPTLEQLEQRKKQDVENEETRKLSIEARNTPLATRIKEIKEDLQTFALCIPNEPAPDGTISKVNKDKKIDNIECNYFIKNGYEYKSRMERIISNYEKCGLDPLADKKKCD